MKKVRTLSVIMVVALLFISCGYSNEDTDKHSHEYIESVICAYLYGTAGYTTYTCSICGDSYLDNYIDAKGHNYNKSVTPPTCMERGYTTYTCSVCGDSYLDNYTNSKGHNYIDHYCDDCNAAKPPETLDDLIFFYEDQMIATCKIKFSAQPRWRI